MENSITTIDRVALAAADINIENGNTITTSLQVAQRFGKRHDRVLRGIKNLLSSLPEEEGRPFFGESSYLNEQNKMMPMYLMNKDAFCLVAMGFTGKDALHWKLAYIAAFNRMAETLSRYVSFGIPGTLYARALEAEKKEAVSFSRASVAGRTLSLRRKEKKVFQGIAAMVREEVQLRLLLGSIE